ncbi:hypothetical protein BGX24_004773 [Mortierella sp. AD032]|nr:hypothetical protein BGX24_004773 [Mortierella sp. AD032]
MQIIALISLTVAALAVSSASPINLTSRTATFSALLARNPHFKPNVHAQVTKLNKRYPDLKVLAGSPGRVPLTDVFPDLEYYGTVSAGRHIVPIKFMM